MPSHHLSDGLSEIDRLGKEQGNRPGDIEQGAKKRDLITTRIHKFKGKYLDRKIYSLSYMFYMKKKDPVVLSYGLDRSLNLNSLAMT